MGREKGDKEEGGLEQKVGRENMRREKESRRRREVLEEFGKGE